MTKLPERIGRYEVQGLVGRGAMGVILRALDPELERRLAIKLIARDLLDGADGSEYAARFQREARASSRVPHPNIAAVHDFGLHEGQPFLAMEFVEGQSLAAELEAGHRFTVAETVLLVGQVLDGLAAAHAAGIVHRDIKPSNILVTPDLTAKIVDFGIAWIGGSDLTRVGDMIGTPSYMSPEQCMAAPVDGRSDLFSSGAVLHELLAGARAFPGSSMIEVVRRVVDGTQTPLPDTIREGFPALAAVVDRALAKKAEDRFGSAEQMAQALRASLAPPAQGPALPDATVIQAPAHVREPMLDDATIGTLERNLAAYIGPIAGVMLRSALRQAGSREELVEKVAAAIQSAPDRARFLAEATRSLAGAAPGPGSSRATATPVAAGPDAAALEAAKKALLPHIGPLASALVRRAAADGAGIDVVWQRLAQHIEQEKERAVFLAKKPG